MAIIKHSKPTMHPDDMVSQLCEVARQNGYEITSVELMSRLFFGVGAPRYVYDMTDRERNL